MMVPDAVAKSVAVDDMHSVASVATVTVVVHETTNNRQTVDTLVIRGVDFWK